MELRARAYASTSVGQPKDKAIEKSEIVIPPVQIKSKVLPNKLKAARPPPQISDTISNSIEQLPMALEMLRRSLAKDDTISATSPISSIQK